MVTLTLREPPPLHKKKFQKIKWKLFFFFQFSVYKAATDLELTFNGLLIVPRLDAQMAQLAQGEVEVDAAVSVVEPESTKARGKRAGRPEIDRQCSGRQGREGQRGEQWKGREASGESHDREEDRGAALLAAAACGEGDACRESAQMFFLFSLPPLMNFCFLKSSRSAVSVFQRRFLKIERCSSSQYSKIQHSLKANWLEGHWNYAVPPRNESFVDLINRISVKPAIPTESICGSISAPQPLKSVCSQVASKW